MRFMSGVASGLAGLLILALGAAHAAPPSFCRSYARTAVAQFDESRANGCGLFGGRWQANLDAHFNWCLGSPIDVVEAEDDFRARELRACRRNLPPEPETFEEARGPDCRNYAQIAAQQNEAQELLRCGFRGGRWQSNRINHYNWCVTQTKGTTDKHNADRDRDVRACKRDREEAMRPNQPKFGFTLDLNFGPKQVQPAGPKARFCRNYANEAAQQSERQEFLGCGYFGNRWIADNAPHFRYCMGVDRRSTLRELDKRRAMLAQCEDEQ
jgi:hypothetical protein